MDLIQTIYPQLAVGRDYVLTKDGALAAWRIQNPRFPRPTDAQLAAARVKLAEPPSPTLGDQLKQILASLKGDNAKVQAIKLASDIAWAAANDHADTIPALLRAFDPGADPELVAAKAAALALLPAPPAAAAPAAPTPAPPATA